MSVSAALELGLSPQDLGLPAKFQHWRPHQEDAILSAASSQKRFVAQAMPTGCHAQGQGILLWDGSVRPVEQINRGDWIMGPDSKPRRVLELIRGSGIMSRITPTKGSAWVVNLDHILSLIETQTGAIQFRSVKDWMNETRNFRWLHKLFRVGVQFPVRSEPLPLDPYFLGVLIGDGSLIHGVSFSKPDPEMHKLAEDVARRYGLRVRVAGGDSYHLVGPYNRWHRNPLSEILRSLGLYGLKSPNKFIPEQYQLSGSRERLELLAGLMDTDGSLGHNCFNLVSASQTLAQNIVFLARSLGLAAYFSESEKYCQTGAGGIYYRVSISGDLDRVPCRIPRKQAGPRKQIKSVLRTAFEVEILGRDDYYGFTLEGDGLYLLEDFTVTHNSGKSAAYVAQAILQGYRVVVLTSTKGLQDQLRNDFSSLHMTDIRGRSNYPCNMSPGMTCEDGAHAGCRSNGTAGCSYTCAHKIAKSAPLVTTNYPYWMLQHKFGEGLGSFDLLVLDEAHNAPEEICSVMSVSITSREVYRMLRADFPPDGSSIGMWSAWAGELLPGARVECDRLSEFAKSRIGGVSLAEVRELREWKSLVSKLETLAEAKGEWEAEAIKGGYKIDPVWASQYADILFLKVPHVLMVSATVVPKTLDLLGLAKEDYDYQEYPSTFPARRSPLIYIPTVRVTHKWQPWMMELWLDRIDQVIGRRLDRKGIIHTVSYDRRNTILERSKYSEYMMSHSTGDAVQQVEAFRASQPPSILVSPAMATGWDFPYESAEYQLIVKIPYPDCRSRIMRARVKADPDYQNYVMSQSLVQSCGRGMRAADDQCENLVVDDMVRVTMATCGGLLPGWFRKLYRRSDTLPEPPPRLERKNRP